MTLSRERGFFAALAGIFVCRLIAGSVLPLSADEAYYWLWSRHLAAGYYDHPPFIAFLIRAGVELFGPTPLGVRIGGILLSFAASWFLWRAAFLLNGEESARRACLLFNLTLMVGVETLAATPDAPSVFAASLFLWALVEFAHSKDGRWWLAAGAAAGLGLLAKYTALFLGAGAVLWLAFSPPYRKYLRSPWPYAGAALALLVFLPNVLWNAHHGWATFAFQFGRAGTGGFSLRYLPDLFGSQAALATPFLFFAVILAFAALSRQRNDDRFLIAALIWPALIYFLEHALHARVQGNWPCFLYPMLAVAAADLKLIDGLTGRWKRCGQVSSRLAAPVAAVMLAAVYAQAVFGVVPMGRGDPLARLLGVGLPDMLQKVEALSGENRAGAILTTDYATTAWLAFYAPPSMPVAQVGEEYRFPDAPPLPATLAKRTLLYVCEDRAGRRNFDRRDLIAAHFSHVEPIARLDRRRNGVVVAEYRVYRVTGPKGGPVGRLP
jgi:4-amino-4-deoxy-L-arabinose transferase-like glycosyltransferase